MNERQILLLTSIEKIAKEKNKILSKDEYTMRVERVSNIINGMGLALNAMAMSGHYSLPGGNRMLGHAHAGLGAIGLANIAARPWYKKKKMGIYDPMYYNLYKKQQLEKNKKK